ncbi:sigma-70 family RNA polymerase sigma factor [Flaviaesturariibacter amylovorans]|uniref:Sigma-70 family RNA polymerase sigma factor n=1 Tax=Flaviaesturariibacter amylovorans TaxID=1084520 RepID=A0ABP8H6X6_9BACT
MNSGQISEQVFHSWVGEHSDLLYQFCRKRVADRETGRDLVQETFLAAWRNRTAYRAETSVKNWLLLILKRKIIDHYRKAGAPDPLPHEEPGANPFFDGAGHWKQGLYPRAWRVEETDHTERKEFYSIFDSCGKKLKALQHHVFTMKYVDGHSSEEICKELGITSSNYWVLLHRAKVQLRACLEKNWFIK